MSLLPIVDRELRAASRRAGTHRLRFFVALAGIALFVLLLLGDGRGAGTRQLGGLIFGWAGALAFGFALVAGVFLTADCVCSERREGTLGLLFLTDLKGYDVVLGKLAASSVVAVYALLGAIPVLGLPLLIGGVSGAEFGRLVVVLMSTLLLSLAAGMFASTVCRDGRAAVLLSLAVMVGLTGLLLLLVLVAGNWFQNPGANWLLLPSPLLGYLRVADGWHAAGAGAAQYWCSVGTVSALAVGLLIVSSLWLPRSWREDGVEGWRNGPGDGPRAIRAAWREDKQELALNPFAWLCGREPFPGRWLRVFLLVVLAAWGFFFLNACLVSSRPAQVSFMAAFFIAFGLHAVVKGLMAIQATRHLAEDRRSGALELLLSTPLSPREIIAGQRRVLDRQFGPWLWMLTLVNLALVVLALSWDLKDMESEPKTLFVLFFLGGIALLWIDYRAIVWLGLWTAVRGARPLRAGLNTLARILGPPWVALLILFVLMARSRGSFEAFIVCWMTWLSLSIISAHVAVANRKRQLAAEFRRMAAGEPSLPARDELQPWSPEWEPRPVETSAAARPPSAPPLR